MGRRPLNCWAARIDATSFVAESAVTLTVPVVAGVRPLLDAARTYVPRAFSVRLEKLATPPLAATVSVPLSALLSEGLWTEMLTLPWKSGSGLPEESRAVTDRPKGWLSSNRGRRLGRDLQRGGRDRRDVDRARGRRGQAVAGRNQRVIIGDDVDR